MKHTDWAGLCAAGLGSHRTSHLPMPLDHAASGSPRGLVVAELSLLRTAGVELLRFHGMAGVFFSTWLTHLCSPWLMHLTLGGWGTSAFQHVPSRLWNHYKIKKKKASIPLQRTNGSCPFNHRTSQGTNGNCFPPQAPPSLLEPFSRMRVPSDSSLPSLYGPLGLTSDTFP